MALSYAETTAASIAEMIEWNVDTARAIALALLEECNDHDVHEQLKASIVEVDVQDQLDMEDEQEMCSDG